MSTHDLNRILHPNIRQFTNAPGFSFAHYTDCFDEDARERVTNRYIGIAGLTPTFRGVADDIVGACALLALLDAKRGAPTAASLNAAPRGIAVQTIMESKPGNGTPFGFVKHEKTLIVSSLKGCEFSLVKRILNLQTFNLLNLHDVTDFMVQRDRMTQSHAWHILDSQFRSFEILPDLAAWLWAEEKLPFTEMSMNRIPDLPGVVWKVDNFGNCTSTIPTDDIAANPGSKIKTSWGELPYYARLCDVPKGTAAIVSGSSGFGFGPDFRFLEIMIGGMGNAAQKLGIKVGDQVFPE